MKLADAEHHDAVRRLGGHPREYTITCRKCGNVEPLPAYAIAQLASGHNLNWTCPCGAERPVLVRSFKRGTP